MTATEAEPARPAPRSVRFPNGSDTLAWYERQAREEETNVNALMVRALEFYRAVIEGARRESEGSHNAEQDQGR
jgi:hypothetical protein